MKSKKIKLSKIDPVMFRDYQLANTMDYNVTTNQIMDKGRGYAVVLVKIRQLTFAVPLRTNIPKKYQLKYKLRDSKKAGCIEGLDFGKVIILESDNYITQEYFRLREIEDYYKLMDNDIAIINRLIDIIISYNKALKDGDSHKLNDPNRFKFTTLVNYHNKIGEITENDKLI